MRAHLFRLTLVVLVCAVGMAYPALAEDARLLRYADVHEGALAFVYAGDIWTVATEGGRARRLTSDEGMELFPKFSPDGRWIAFSAEYSGNRQVWVISADGGAPRQLTFYNDVGPMPPRGGFDYQVMDWTPDGKHVLFRANRLPWGVRMGRPYLVPVEGGMEEPLPVPESGGGMFSPDGTKLVYTPISREFRTWKRYHGGRAQDVWIFDLEKIEAEPITTYDGTDNQPVWVEDTIYFTSDREDGRLNLWAYDTVSRKPRRVTRHSDFDVLWPSAGPRQVVYESGGYLYVFDPEKGSSQRVPIEIGGDYPQTLPYYRNVEDFIGGASISPSGARVAIEARGELFSVPAENGVTRNLTASQGVREMSPAWSPDGSQVVYLSDRTGEYEIYVRNQDGTGDERRLTRDGDVWRLQPVWSPDGKRLAFGDMKQRLRWLDVDSGRIKDIDHGEAAAISTYRWSPDSRWIVYDKLDLSRLSSIHVYSVDEDETYQLTDSSTSDYDPVFDPKGRYLYFLSDRDFNLTFSGFEFNYFYTNPTRVYGAVLREDGPPLLAPDSDEEQPAKSDEEEGEEEENEEDEEGEDAEEEEDDDVRIDLEGLADRVVALPGPPANYRGLAATDDSVFFIESDNGESMLRMFSLEDESTETVLESVGGYEISADQKKILFVAGGTWGIVDAAPEQDAAGGALDFSGLRVRIDPREEWRQIFADGWRITRDYFYDPDMHGVGWNAIRKLYEPLVDSVVYRADLDYIFGEMGGELAAGHYYVNWGDSPGPERVDGGLLGAEIVSDPSGYFRITSIMKGENWHGGFRSPLTETGVDVEQGDYILAVDGRSTKEVENFYELLEGKAGNRVALRVNAVPEMEGSRVEDVRPIARETNLRYLEWVSSRRELVDRLSDGRIGYIHLPNTATEGNRELRKHFYPQARKEALILDVRYNGGGFIPDRMIELVARTQLSFWARRGIDAMRTPGYAHTGPKVCLINAYSSSGGDAFPYYFRKLGLGSLIGTRTWGGLIGLSGNPGFVDGGAVLVPRFRFYDTDGKWAVEGEGVAPDIEVTDRPDLVAKGADPTLEKAVEQLLEQLRGDAPKDPEDPPPPTIRR